MFFRVSSRVGRPCLKLPRTNNLLTRTRRISRLFRTRRISRLLIPKNPNRPKRTSETKMSPIEAPEMPIPFGISADTGQPLEGIDDAALDSFKVTGLNGAVAKEYLKTKAESDEPDFGTIGDVDSSQLDQAGWAVIFSPSADQKIREALQPLLDRRKAQVGD